MPEVMTRCPKLYIRSYEYIIIHVCISSFWFLSPQCSRSCNHGYRVREVRCLTDNITPSDHCDPSLTPKNRTECNTQPCVAEISTSTQQLLDDLCKRLFTNNDNMSNNRVSSDCGDFRIEFVSPTRHYVTSLLQPIKIREQRIKEWKFIFLNFLTLFSFCSLRSIMQRPVS